jgi:hypothetical protein
MKSESARATADRINDKIALLGRVGYALSSARD